MYWFDEVFFTAGIAADFQPLGHQEAIRGDAQAGVMPSRQLMFWNALSGKDCANALTLTGCLLTVRRGTTGGRPMPL